MGAPERRSIRLIALDLDGTLFNNNKVIPAHTLDVLHRAMEQGVIVVPATGRPATGLPSALMALPGIRYVLTSNGARVVDLSTGKAIVDFPVDKQLTLDILQVLFKFDCLPSLFCSGERVCPAGDVARVPDFLEPAMVPYVQGSSVPVQDIAAYVRQSNGGIEKINAFFRSSEERSQAWAQLEALPQHPVVTSSLAMNMEINAPGVHKGRGLMALAGHLGIDAAQVMACGDSGNDMGMIQAAGLGVAMANATAPILAAADYVTLSNQEEGVAAAVEKFVLS